MYRAPTSISGHDVSCPYKQIKLRGKVALEQASGKVMREDCGRAAAEPEQVAEAEKRAKAWVAGHPKK
jgi:hypothetical protein